MSKNALKIVFFFFLPLIIFDMKTAIKKSSFWAPISALSIGSMLLTTSVVTQPNTSIKTSSNKVVNSVYATKPYDEKMLVGEVADQFDLVSTELVNSICSSSQIPQIYKDDAIQLHNIVNEEMSPIFAKIIANTPTIDERKDPMDIFQEVLSFFRDDIMGGINVICHHPFVVGLFGQERLDQFTKLWRQILGKEISLKEYAKSHWSLQDIFEGILYPLCGEGEQGKEKAWELIFSVYSDTYYTGLNYNHKNGDEIQGNYQLLDKPTYAKNKYDWKKVQPGDIVFSNQGFALGGHYSGHCAIVDGWYTAPIQGLNEYATYLRVIEANQYGISYGLLDDVRMDSEQMTVLHIAKASKDQRLAALQFCEAQLGKHYNIPIFLSEDTSPDTAAWYCSELVWAAYKNQGIDIQSNEYYTADIPGILPWEIYFYKDSEIVIDWNAIN